jgi:ABC-2 type transport system ATP-binding protein
MRQKLALARALLHEPPVLLLDEPTSAMDPESARLVRQAISGLRTENRAIIICTHNLVEAESLADRIAIIYRGRVLTQGTMDELKRNLLGQAEYLVRARAGTIVRDYQPPTGARLLVQTKDELIFRVGNPEKVNHKILKDLIDQGVEVVSMQEIPRSLEEVYLAAMKQVSDD